MILRKKVVGQLVTLEREQERLNYYVSLLGPRHAELLKLLYFEGYSQEECAKKLEIATRTVRRIKDDAIAELVEMYSFTGGVQTGRVLKLSYKFQKIVRELSAT